MLRRAKRLLIIVRLKNRRAISAGICMPIKFRCTACNARLHVPDRWSGTSVPCPKCSTRVVVPAVGLQQVLTRFEQADIEKSIQGLEPRRGGIFADALFERPLPVAAVASQDGIPRSRSIFYALVVVFVAFVAVGSFLLGAWWYSPSNEL